MKAVLFILLAALMALVSIGCSNSPVSVSPVSGEAVAKVTINLEKIGVLGKVAASNKTPTMILVNGRVMNQFGEWIPDTILISGTSPVVGYINGFERGETYQLSARAMNSDGLQLNACVPISYTVPNSDTFAVSMTLHAGVEQFLANVPISGTVVASKACSVMVITQNTPVSGEWGHPDTSITKFSPGTVDTVKVDKLLGISPSSATKETPYTVAVVIFLNDGTYYKGSSVVALKPSLNISTTIELTRYGAASSLAKMTISIGAIGTFLVDVEFL